MDFKLVILVLFAYFIRPQDWVPGMAGINIMKPLMAVTLLAMFARRRGISAGSFVKTPIDWAIIAYGIYIVASAPAGQRPFATVFVLVAYYFVTSQALSTPKRQTVFLRCWLICLLIVAAMALASEYGLDLTGAKKITNAVPDKPRLALNTYLFDNPNSLGHSVVIAIPLAYFVLFWHRPISHKIVAVVAILIAAYCVFLTKSKGSYIVGFMVVVAAQLLGRSRIFQVITLLLALTVGLELLNSLPRMADIGKARQDEAIMGRMMAWEQARGVSRESATGEGFKNFKAILEFDGEEIFKATHSSYVLVGAELGRNGMFFFLAVLYACLRVLATAHCPRQEDEATRRALFVLLLAYMISSWLIDRSYHLEYFLLAGAVSGFHRRLGVEAELIDPAGEVTPDEYVEYDGANEREEEEASEDDSARLDTEPPEDEETISRMEDVDATRIAEEARKEILARRWYWRRFGVFDILLVVLFTKIVFDVWDYLLRIYFL